MPCEDFPCCGHEPGCCPDFDPETGQQLNMKCTCGAPVPLSANCSLCKSCIQRLLAEEGELDDFSEEDDDFEEEELDD